MDIWYYNNLVIICCFLCRKLHIWTRDQFFFYWTALHRRLSLSPTCPQGRGVKKPIVGPSREKNNRIVIKTFLRCFYIFYWLLVSHRETERQFNVCWSLHHTAAAAVAAGVENDASASLCRIYDTNIPSHLINHLFKLLAPNSVVMSSSRPLLGGGR